MPYFHNKDIHVLYIHVPKTGGTSIETYFSKKYNIPISATCLYSGTGAFLSVSLQHQTLSTLCSHTDKFNIVLDDSLIILVSVRNPYTRLLSHPQQIQMRISNQTSSRSSEERWDTTDAKTYP